MIEAPRYEEPAGPWWRPVWLSITKGAWSASFMCPNRHYGSLMDHEIAADGTVSPSVVCPTEGCDFHEHVRLVGWEDLPSSLGEVAVEGKA